MTSVTVAAQSVELVISGAPDVKNRYGSGTIRPSDVTLHYRDGSIRAALCGRWRREDGELTDAPCSQNYAAYKGDTTDWPGWLADLARAQQPAIKEPRP
jgi:hypothetical protein